MITKKGKAYYCDECGMSIAATTTPGVWLEEFKKKHEHPRKEAIRKT